MCWILFGVIILACLPMGGVMSRIARSTRCGGIITIAPLRLRPPGHIRAIDSSNAYGGRGTLATSTYGPTLGPKSRRNFRRGSKASLKPAQCPVAGPSEQYWLYTFCPSASHISRASVVNISLWTLFVFLLRLVESDCIKTVFAGIVNII